jgi:hypothetical protein
LEGKTRKKSEVFRADFLDSYGFYLDFDRWFDLERAREVGFVEERNPCEGWFEAFDRFRAAGMIP